MSKCKFCEEEKEFLVTHHLIPRWFKGVEGDTIEICQGCHNKLERWFINFLFFGNFKIPEEYQNDAKIRYAKRHPEKKKEWVLRNPTKGKRV